MTETLTTGRQDAERIRVILYTGNSYTLLLKQRSRNVVFFQL